MIFDWIYCDYCRLHDNQSRLGVFSGMLIVLLECLVAHRKTMSLSLSPIHVIITQTLRNEPYYQ